MSAPDISVVIPIFNEEQGLPLLCARLFPALDALRRPYEVIFIDDGSRDGSAAALREIFAKRRDVVRVLLLRFNVGQHLAILAGFERTRGRHVVTLMPTCRILPRKSDVWSPNSMRATASSARYGSCGRTSGGAEPHPTSSTRSVIASRIFESPTKAACCAATGATWSMR